MKTTKRTNKRAPSVAICKTLEGEYLFVDYCGKWRPIKTDCHPRIFSGGIPHHHCKVINAAIYSAEPYPDLPNLNDEGVITNG